MSSIIRQKVGKNIYLYESFSYRNKEGKPRNRRNIIGKIDPKTGNPIYKPEYLERMAAAGTPVEILSSSAVFSLDDVRRSSIRDYGAFYLFNNLSERSGLLDSLKASLPKYWEEAFTLACYLVSSGDPFLYCEDWLSSTESYPVGNMSSQRISELMAAICSEERDLFYQTWCAKRSESEYLALDITSCSSYSQLIDSVEWGYNRDKEQLPQINICMLMGYSSRLPVYQSIYNGSLKDVTTLNTTLAIFRELAGDKRIIVVMDKGFFSTRNVNAMLGQKNHTEFLLSVPFTCAFARKQIDSERKDIDVLENTIVVGGDSLRAVTKVRKWSAEHSVYTHIYYNARKAMGRREDLFAYVSELQERALATPEKYVNEGEYSKYLLIRRSVKQPNGYTVTIRNDVVQRELERAGWMVIISNCVDSARDAIKIYREKDVAEKGFLRLKNRLDLDRLRMHSHEAMQNKVFIGFLSLILLTDIHNTMLDRGLYKSMTIKKLVLNLSKLRVQEINGTRILFPLTKVQKEIYKAFSLPEPL